jgi:hypothetical protein
MGVESLTPERSIVLRLVALLRCQISNGAAQAAGQRESDRYVSSNENVLRVDYSSSTQVSARTSRPVENGGNWRGRSKEMVAEEGTAEDKAKLSMSQPLANGVA